MPESFFALTVKAQVGTDTHWFGVRPPYNLAKLPALAVNLPPLSLPRAVYDGLRTLILGGGMTGNGRERRGATGLSRSQ
jgi:hypothetical protein